MATWKVLLIGFWALVCFGLAVTTMLMTLGSSGGERWAWLGGLGGATLVAGGLLALFLRWADKSMDGPVRRK